MDAILDQYLYDLSLSLAKGKPSEWQHFIKEKFNYLDSELLHNLVTTVEEAFRLDSAGKYMTSQSLLVRAFSILNSEQSIKDFISFFTDISGNDNGNSSGSSFYGQVCPYCQSTIEETAEIIVCSDCNTPHHSDCWHENGGCTIFGCNGSSMSPRETQVIELPNNLDLTHKQCPYCAETILAGAIKCKHCYSMLDVPHQQTSAPEPVIRQSNQNSYRSVNNQQNDSCWSNFGSYACCCCAFVYFAEIGGC